MIAMEWDKELAPSVAPRRACAEVARQVRLLLDHDVRFHEATISTADLVEMLYPVAHARGDVGVKARQRLFRCLFALATRELSDCCTKGEAVPAKFGKSQKRPWLWHKPTVPNGERHRGERLSLFGCPQITPRPSHKEWPGRTNEDLDNDWIDDNFEAVLWFLKAMTRSEHEDDTRNPRKVA